MGWLLWIGAALALLVVAGGLYVRVAPDDPARWHVDPLEAPDVRASNSYLVAASGAVAGPMDLEAPVYMMSADELAEAFDAMAMSQPRTQRLAGGPAIRWTTYVQRSRAFGFPDYVSVRFFDLGDDTASLALLSRSRYGKDDLGVNAARVANWLAALERFER